MNSLFDSIKSDFRLIIIDNGSSDETSQYLRDLSTITRDHQYCKSYDVLMNKNNLGIACGRNQALKIADRYKSPYLCTFDNDVDFTKNPNWLMRCIDVLQAIPKFSIGLNMEGINYPIQTINGKTLEIKPKGNLGTVLTVFPKELHDKLGFFNTEFGIYGEEDADYFIRSRMLSWKMGFLEKGNHIGEGENDTGEYRTFKNIQHQQNLIKFQQTCHLYAAGKKPVYTTYSCPGEEDPLETISEIY